METEQYSTFGCFSMFGQVETNSFENIQKAKELLIQAGMIVQHLPSAKQAHSYLTQILNGPDKNSACGIGFLRHSNSTRHHLALSFIDDNSNIQHLDISQTLETNAHIIIAYQNDLAGLSKWVKTQCSKRVKVSELLTQHQSSITTAPPPILHMGRS